MPEIQADIAVIGGGMAGLPLANKAAYKGQKTVLVEQELLGGTCLNRGCIPTKTMIESARVAQVVRTARRFGIGAQEPQVDLAAIVQRKNEVLESIRTNAYRQVRSNDNLILIEAKAVFEGPGRLRAGDTVVEAERIIINTGARPAIPPVEGLAEVPYYTSRTLLDVTELPPSLLVLGGGYVGCEFAQMFARFGSKVTMLQRPDRLLNHEDAEISDVLTKVFRDEGIDVLTGYEVTRAEQTAHGIRLTARGNGKTRHIEGSTLLVAVGRRPNTDKLNLEAVGVETDGKGFIVADEAFKTSRQGIWAIGDVTGSPMFTHSARDDADRLYRHLLKDEDVTIEGRNVPYAIFTDPEIAAVGLTEQEAAAKGYSLKIGKHPFSRVARARAMGETAGFIKIVADAETDRLLGAQIIGPRGGELIHELVVALVLGATYDQIGRVLHVHPTLSEGINSAAGGVHRPAGD